MYGFCGPHWRHGGPWVSRRYFGKEERVRLLEEYKKELEAELAGVNEQIKELTEEKQ